MKLAIATRSGAPETGAWSARVVLAAGLAALTISWAASASGAPPALNKAIDAHRKGTLTVLAPPGAKVGVEQLRHEFWFGAALSNSVFSGHLSAPDEATYKRIFLENFNSAVTENALKWHSMERERGRVDYSVVDAMLEWTDQHEIPLRGHNIFWGVPNRVQPWLKELDDDGLREALKSRATTIGRRYRGRFAEYDLNNEMMHANYYEQRLGTDITRQMAEWVKEGDRDAVLYVNDYDVLTGNRLRDFGDHIRRLLDQRVPIDGIGVQGHLHEDTFDPQALRNALDQLAKFQRPVRVTEFNMPGQRSSSYRNRRARLTPDEEEAKAKALTQYYRICFAHPAVDGILMWGFWERANWIPASSLYKSDWTPTPAAAAYRDLVFREWWTNWQGEADADGKCQVQAFFGKHRVTVGEHSRIVDLTKVNGSAAVQFSD